MFADENLRGENRKLGRTALGNEHDVEEGIGDAGFWCDWDTARDIASIGIINMERINLKLLTLLNADVGGVTRKLTNCCGAATQLAEGPQARFISGCEFLFHNAVDP